MKMFFLYVLLTANDGTQSLNKVTGNAYNTWNGCNTELKQFNNIQSKNVKLICTNNIKEYLK